ncbi:hypothetical protein [Priestia aryabhattai]|uniref:hypothetical protein n=1 Tax=Priestia aryabhattai TaxID=412384 RepID=UPI0039833DB2
MIEGQGEDSCGKSGTGEPPHERKRRGDSAAARGCTEINCGVISSPTHVSHLFVFRFGSFSHVSTSLFMVSQQYTMLLLRLIL